MAGLQLQEITGDLRRLLQKPEEYVKPWNDRTRNIFNFTSEAVPGHVARAVAAMDLKPGVEMFTLVDEEWFVNWTLYFNLLIANGSRSDGAQRFVDPLFVLLGISTACPEQGKTVYAVINDEGRSYNPHFGHLATYFYRKADAVEFAQRAGLLGWVGLPKVYALELV